LGPELGLELLWNTRAVVSTRLGVAASRTWSGPVETDGGTASFTLDQIQAELCPLRLGGEHWEVRPCLEAAGGRILAAGSNTNSPRSEQRQWGTLGAGARTGSRLR
jgi:hypothetical protein